MTMRGESRLVATGAGVGAEGIKVHAEISYDLNRSVLPYSLRVTLTMPDGTVNGPTLAARTAVVGSIYRMTDPDDLTWINH